MIINLIHNNNLIIDHFKSLLWSKFGLFGVLSVGIVSDSSNFELCPSESIGLKFIPNQSELFRFIPISVSEPMRIIPNQSEKRLVSRLLKNDKKSIRINPIDSETPIRMNPNQSETKFAIQINPFQFDFGLIQIEFSIRINLIGSE